MYYDYRYVSLAARLIEKIPTTYDILQKSLRQFVNSSAETTKHALSRLWC
jgi:hypothetical protein